MVAPVPTGEQGSLGRRKVRVSRSSLHGHDLDPQRGARLVRGASFDLVAAVEARDESLSIVASGDVARSMPDIGLRAEGFDELVATHEEPSADPPLLKSDHNPVGLAAAPLTRHSEWRAARRRVIFGPGGGVCTRASLCVASQM